MTRNRTAALRQSLALSSALGVSLVVATPVWGQNGQKGSFGTVTDTSSSAAVGGNPDITVVTQNGGPNRLQVDLNARNTVIEWNGFNVDAGKVANFNDGRSGLGGRGGEQAVLNRVSGSATRIEGSITSDANVQVWIVNGAGILLGGGANINVGGLVLSALDLNATNVEAFRTTGALADYNVRFANARTSTSRIGMVSGATLPASITTANGILALIAPAVDVNVDTKSGTGATAFAIATDVSMQATRGGPLTLTLNQGTQVASNRVRGTVIGDRVYALITPDAALNTLLNVEASVTNASVNARGVVVLGGESASVDVPLGGGARDRLIVMNTSAGATDLTLGNIDFLDGNATSGSVTMRSVGGAISVNDIASRGDISIGNVGPGTVSIKGDVDSRDDYIIMGGSVVLGTLGQVRTQTVVDTVTLTATAGTVSSAGDLRLRGNTANNGSTVMTIGGAATTGLDFGDGSIVSGAAGGYDILFRTADASGQFVLSDVFARNLRAQLGAGGNVTAIDRIGNAAFTGLSLSGSNTIRTSANLVVNGAVATAGSLTLTGGTGVTVSGALTNAGSSTGSVTINANVDPAAGIQLAAANLSGNLAVNAGGGGIRFDSLAGSGNKSLTAAGIIQGGQAGTVAIGGSGAVTLTTGASGQDIVIGGSIGSSTTSIASLDILRAGQVLLGPMFVAGVTNIGVGTGVSRIDIDGNVRAGAFISDSFGSTDIDALTATVGGVSITTRDAVGTINLDAVETLAAGGARNITLVSGGAINGTTLTARDIVSATTQNGGAITLTGGSSGSGSFTVSSAGDATVRGGVTAAGDYTVTGTNVALGNTSSPSVQRANGIVRIEAIGGSIASNGALELQSASGNAIAPAIFIGGAQTGALALGGSVLNATGSASGDVRFATLSDASDFVVGDVRGRTVSQQINGDVATNGIDRTGSATLGNLTLTNDTMLVSDVALTVGNVSTDGVLAITGGTLVSIGTLAGNGDKTVTSGGDIVSTVAPGGQGIGGTGSVTLNPTGALTMPGAIGTAGTRVASLTVGQGGAVVFGPLFVATATSLGAATPLGSLMINGPIVTSSLLSRTVGSTGFGAIAVTGTTAATGGIDIATTTGDLTVAGALTTAGTVGATGTDIVISAGGAASTQALSATRAVQVSATGAAGVAGNVTAGTSYAVNGASVTLGGAGVTQQAGTTLSVAAAAGTVTGGAGLTLISGSGDMTLGGAGTTGLQFGGTTLGAGGLTDGSGVRNIVLATDTAARPIALGSVIADRLVQQVAGALATVGTVAVAGDLSFGNLTLGTAGGANAIGASGALTVGNAGIDSVRVGGPLSLTAGTTATVNGRIVNIATSTAPVAITGFTIDIDDVALNGELTLSPGGGGIGFGVLTGTGARAIVTTGGITGVGIEGSSAVTLSAGAAPITISGGIGRAGSVGSLTIDGGSGVTLGTAGSTATTLNVAGAITVGATTQPGSLVVNGGIVTGGNFTARTIGAIDLDTVADLTATPGTLSLTTASGPISFADLLGAGTKTLASGTGIQGSTIAGPGSVTLTAADPGSITLSSIGTVGGAVAALTINGGSVVTLGTAGSSATNVIVAGSTAIGQTPRAVPGSLILNGALTTGTISATTTGTANLGLVTSAGAASFKAGGDVDFADVTSGGAIDIAAGGAVRGGTLTAGGAVGVTSAGAASIVGGVSGSGGDFAVSAGGAATISGAVSASGGYRVRGASVALGGGTVAQSANGLVDITAVSGSMVAGAGLALSANTDGAGGESLVLDGSGGPIQFGGTTLIGGTAGQRSDVRIRVGTPATPVTLDIVTARALVGTDAAHDGTGALSTAGDVTITSADLQQGLSIVSSGGAITLGTIAVSNAGQGVTLTTEGAGGDIRVTSLTAPGAVSIGARGAAAVGSASAGTLSITGASAALNTANIGGAFGIASNAGPVTLGTAVAGGAASLTSAGDLTLASLQSGGTATINAAGNAELGRVRVTTGDLLVTTGRDIVGPGATRADMATLGTGGDIRIAAGRNALLGPVAGADAVAVTAASVDATSVTASTGSLSLNATAGDVILAEGIAGGAATLVATGRIAATRLTAAGIDMAAGSSLSGTDLISTGALTARAGTTIDYARATGTDLGMTAGGTITLGQAGASGELNLTSTNGALALGTATAGGAAALRSGAAATATSVRATGAASVNAGGAIRIGLLDGAGVTSTGASIDIGSTTSGGGLGLTATGGGVTLGTGVAATTATLSATGPLSITASLTAAGNVAAAASGAVTLASVSSTTGSITASGSAIAAATLRSGTTMSLDATAGAVSLTTGTAGAAATLRATGAMNLGTLTAGGAAALTAGSTLSTTTLNATGAATLAASGAATLGAITAGGAVAITANGVTAGRTVAGAGLTVTSGGALSVASAQAGGDALFDAQAAATIGAVTSGSASGITVRATDAAITGSQTAGRVSFVNRAPASTGFKLGNGTSAGGFALSQDEVNFVNSRALTLDAGSGAVELGTLAFANAAGSASVDVLTTGRIDVLGVVSGGGAGRTFRLGGTADNIAGKASVIQLVTTTTGGARLLMNDANLDLRGARIGAGQTQGFLDAIDFDQATGLSPNAVAAAFVGNVDSSLYNPTFGGTVYAPPGAVYLTANSLTVRYSDYALFQNSGAAGTNAGVALGSATAPVNGALVIQASGNVPFNSFAIFGTINGVDDTSTALLGSAVIGLAGANIGATRINGCIIGSGAGCLTSVVSQPALAIFDSSRIDVFRSVDDLVLPFDPVIGTSNEALFSGITLLDTPADASDCVLGSSANCGAVQGGAK